MFKSKAKKWRILKRKPHAIFPFCQHTDLSHSNTFNRTNLEQLSLLLSFCNKKGNFFFLSTTKWKDVRGSCGIQRIILLVRLRIFTQLNTHVVGSVSSKKKKREYLMKRKCSFIGAITEQSIQT